MEHYAPVRSNFDMMLYRVVIVQHGSEYIIHTGDKMLRLFQEHALPEAIASKLSMIKAYEPKIVQDLQIENMTTHTPYIRQEYPEDFSDIGWYVGYYRHDMSKMYCVLMDRDLLYKLRGEA